MRQPINSRKPLPPWGWRDKEKSWCYWTSGASVWQNTGLQWDLEPRRRCYQWWKCPLNRDGKKCPGFSFPSNLHSSASASHWLNLRHCGNRENAAYGGQPEEGIRGQKGPGPAHLPAADFVFHFCTHALNFPGPFIVIFDDFLNVFWFFLITFYSYLTHEWITFLPFLKTPHMCGLCFIQVAYSVYVVLYFQVRGFLQISSNPWEFARVSKWGL